MLVWAGFMFFVIRYDGQSGDFERGNDLVRSYWLATIGVQVIMIGNLADAQEDCRQTQSDLRSNLYHPAAFVLGHVLFKLFSMVFLVTPYSVAVYYFLGMQASVSESSTLEKYSYLLTVFLLLGSIVESLNTIVGFMYLKANTTKAVYACISIHVFFGLFSGGLFRWCGTEFFIKVLSYLSPTKYVLEGLLLNNWEEVEYSFTLANPAGCANGGTETYAAWRDTDPTGTWAAKYYCTDEFPWMDDKVDIAYVLLGYMVFFGLCMLLQLRKVV